MFSAPANGNQVDNQSLISSVFQIGNRRARTKERIGRGPSAPNGLI